MTSSRNKQVTGIKRDASGGRCDATLFTSKYTTPIIATAPSCGSETGCKPEVRTSPTSHVRPDATLPRSLRRDPSSSSPTTLSSAHPLPRWTTP
ncbi:hypothetical protein TNCV_1891931 [Trichonephila clavipes]|nr:hypothetical protein TNCV_1891931 [Trichonephila clavipes]